MTDRTAPVVPSSARTPEGGALCKKEEIRARRFGARDKSKKLTLAPTTAAAVSTAAVAAAAAGGRGKLGGGGSPEGGGGGETVAQSLEALTRRADAVAQDLERVESGLVELEVEEAEEAGEAGTGGEEVAADPLDMFMASNRKNEREQAVLRLSAQRDSLREERTLLKAMVEAARPSMPSLKPASGKPVAAGKDAAAAVVSGESRGSSPPGGALAAGEALAAAGVAVSSKSSNGEKEEKEKEEPNMRISRHSSGWGDARDIASGGNSGSGGGGGGSRRSDSKKESDVEAEVNVPSVSTPLAAPAALPRRPGDKAAAIPADRTAVISRGDSAGGRDGGNGGSGLDTDVNVGSDNKEGAPPSPAPQEVKSGNATTKKRGTPVGPSMLHPPPAKRPQPKRNTSTAADKKDDSPASSNGKRAVRGPAAMPPPPVASVSAGRVTAGAAGSKEPRKEGLGAKGGGKVAGKGVLEGGDADWVPPKGQAGDGRTALNLKFGY